MNTNDLDRSLNAWFDAVEPRGAPAEVLPNVFAVTRRLGQRRGLRARMAAAMHVGPLEGASAAGRVHRMALATIGVAAAGLVAVVGLAALYGGGLPTIGDQPSPSSDRTVPQAQMATLQRMVEALNVADADAFADAFEGDGFRGFDALSVFDDGSSGIHSMEVPITDRSVVRAWIALVEVWGLEAEVLGCASRAQDEVGRQVREDSDWFVECEVTTRWHTLSMEVDQKWLFELQGAQLFWWEANLGELNPVQRQLPLGHDGLVDWERWLQANRPAEADRYLSPGWEGYVIEGVRFRLAGFASYDPALAEEIKRSIQQYLSVPPAPDSASLPAEQMTVIARHAAALNNRDADAFVDVFDPEGAFNPRGTFASSSLFSDTLPIADRSLIEPFLAISEAWGFDAEVVACEQLSKSDYDRRYGRASRSSCSDERAPLAGRRDRHQYRVRLLEHRPGSFPEPNARPDADPESESDADA
jgi:hypothetical protein